MIAGRSTPKRAESEVSQICGLLNPLMKILTIDDSATARLIVRRTFESMGHDVIEAQDGAEALTVLENQSPVDVIILDWNMPVMNGFDCLCEIRKDAGYKDVKIVMCTTEAEKPSIVRAVKAGADGYVLKPVTPSTLIDQVAKVSGATI